MVLCFTSLYLSLFLSLSFNGRGFSKQRELFLLRLRLHVSEKGFRLLGLNLCVLGDELQFNSRKRYLFNFQIFGFFWISFVFFLIFTLSDHVSSFSWDTSTSDLSTFYWVLVFPDHKPYNSSFIRCGFALNFLFSIF